jgi:MoaD family protein
VRVSVRGYLTFRVLVEAQQISLDEGGTLRALLEGLARAVGEEFSLRIFHAQEGLRPGVSVLVNGRSVAQKPGGLALRLHDGDEVAIFPPLAGGGSSHSGRRTMPHGAGGGTAQAARRTPAAGRRLQP